MTLHAPSSSPPTAQTPTAHDWPAILAGEALVFGLLGKLLFDEPQPAFVQTLADEAVFDEIPFGAGRAEVDAGLQLLQQWSRQHQGGLLNGAFDDLRGDFTRLFVGPGKVLAVPWESAQLHLERPIFQEETLQVRNWYRRFGLEAAKLYNEPDDHIGLELAFLAHLAQRGLAALAEGDQARLAAVLEAQRQFLAAHPLRWIPAWCDQVEAHARTDFYRGVALVTRGALAEMAATLEIDTSARAAR